MTMYSVAQLSSTGKIFKATLVSIMSNRLSSGDIYRHSSHSRTPESPH
jgi:hypothetical protein